MQTGKNAAATVKESALNVAASAKSGLDKTKAIVQEKVDKMTGNDPLEKEMATQKKEEKIIEAEQNKQAVYMYNAGTKQAAAAGVVGATTTAATAGHHMTGTGQPHGAVIDPPAEGGSVNQGYGTGT